MDISKIGFTKTNATSKSKKTSNTPSSGFSDALGTDETSDTQNTHHVAFNPLSASFLSISPQKDYESAQHYEDVLDELEKIKIDLLMGMISPATLKGLATLSKDYFDKVSDDTLKNIAQEIEVRAQVELAKYEKLL